VPVAHPASRWLMVVIAILGVMVAHPDTETLGAGLGQTALYVAVFAPLFWVPAFVTDRRTLIRVLVILLVCNGINSIVGVLQVYDPARWMPKEFSSTYMLSRDLMSTAAYMGPNGRLIIRPPGLYDTPGAVCGAGTVAALLGVIFCLEKMAWWKRILALGFAGAGLAAIYLSQVRSSLMVALGMLAVYTALLILQKQKARAVALLGLTGGLAAAALVLATLLGGASIQNRFSTVVQGNPTELYYKSRGNQVQAVVNNAINGQVYERSVEPRLLLSDFLRHELRLPHECCFGSCATCRIKLVEGTVCYEGTMTEFLADEDARQAYLAV